MDTSDETAVSLDELTVELIEDNSKQDIILGDSEDKTDILDFYSMKDAISNATDLYEDSGFKTKEFEQSDSNDVPVQHISDLKGNACQGDKTLISIPDCEDEALLSFLNISKINTSDDSDFEFEVPERPVAVTSEQLCSQSISTNSETHSSNTLAEKHCLKNYSEIDTKVTSMHPNYFLPDILQSHDQVAADFTIHNKNNLPISTLQNVTLLSQNEHTDISNLALGHKCEDVKDDKVSSLHFSKDETFIYSSSNIQHQFSEGVIKQHQTFIAFPTQEDNRNDAEESLKPSIVTTAEDWEEIQTVEPGFLQSSDRMTGPAPAIESKPLASFADTWVLFETADYSSVKSQIKTCIERHGFSALKHMIFGPPKLRKELQPQRDLIFCLAATQFDNDNESHIRVLQTIYRCLTGSKFDCQRFGGHWEEIGFQGKDPATDLRGTGMLALLHLLYFLQSPSTKGLSRDIYKLSLHPTQNFPFCLMSINLSRICLQVLREDVFNKECNSCREVTSTINNVYAALFLRLFREWKKGKTIMDSGFVLQEVETYCRKHSKTIIKDLEAYEKSRKQQGQSRKDSDHEPTFFNVCKEDQVDTKSHSELS